jgi:hypothetical protein
VCCGLRSTGEHPKHNLEYDRDIQAKCRAADGHPVHGGVGKCWVQSAGFSFWSDGGVMIQRWTCFQAARFPDLPLQDPLIWNFFFTVILCISAGITANVSTEGAAKKIPFGADFDRIQRIACNWMGSTCIDLKSG